MICTMLRPLTQTRMMCCCVSRLVKGALCLCAPFTSLDTQQHIMRVCVRGLNIVQIIGRYHRNLHLFVQLVEQLVEFTLGGGLSIIEGAVMLLDLQVEVLRSEHILVPACRLIYFFCLPGKEHLW